MSATTIEVQAPASRSIRSFLTGGPVWLVSVAASVAAAVVAELFSLIPRGLDVPMEAGPMYADTAQDIPPGSFAMSTLTYGIIGVVVAVLLARKAKQPARTFVVVAVVGTALSELSPLTAVDTATATKVSLVLAHLVAAAVAIPLIATRLSHAGPGVEQSD